MKAGDIVSRKSYDSDVLFRIMEINNSENGKNAILKGLELRIIADAPVEDLIAVDSQEIREYKGKFIRISNECLQRIIYRRKIDFEKRGFRGINEENENLFFDRPGKVLHIDGDEEYLEICLNTYKRLDMKVIAEHIPEEQQPKKLKKLLNFHNPDILVLTGHDGMLNNKSKKNRDFNKLASYRNSKYFVESVKIARDFEPSLDDLVIFAGACQSHYEAILRVGANFASSPHRVLIHCLDPVFITEKIAFKTINEIISIQDVIGSTITGIKGIGGFQTRGKYREGLPRSPYE